MILSTCYLADLWYLHSEHGTFRSLFPHRDQSQFHFIRTILKLLHIYHLEHSLIVECDLLKDVSDCLEFFAHNELHTHIFSLLPISWIRKIDRLDLLTKCIILKSSNHILRSHPISIQSLYNSTECQMTITITTHQQTTKCSSFCYSSTMTNHIQSTG